MSAFGRSRRQVYLDADLVDLLKVAAPHETWQLDPHDEDKSVRCTVGHTAETLLDQIIRAWSEQPKNIKYVELLKMRNAAREQVDREWLSSSSAGRLVPETHPAQP